MYLITNQERFEKICRALADETVAPRERLIGVDALVGTLERYRFLGEGGLKLETVIGAAKLAAKTMLACDTLLSDGLKQALDTLVAAKRTKNHLDELEALRALEAVSSDNAEPPQTDYGMITSKLVKIVWGYVAMHYFWLKERGSS